MFENRFLASLARSDSDLLKPLLKPVQLHQQTVLYEMGEPVPAVYFPTGAIVSLVLPLTSGEHIEASMVGRDGVLGAASALDGKKAVSRAIVQISGGSLTCSCEDFKKIVFSSPSLMIAVLRHEQTLFAEAQQSNACMAVHQIEARLARWLLRSRDLAGTENLYFTQEFLAEMLGATRPSVSVVAHAFKQSGLIKYNRGQIEILDLEGLQDTVCECYGAIKKQYEELVGPHNQ